MTMPTQQITTESHVVIEDPDMVTTGDGMLVQLRKGRSVPSWRVVRIWWRRATGIVQEHSRSDARRR